MPSETQLKEKQYDFASPSNVNNFDGIENARMHRQRSIPEEDTKH